MQLDGRPATATQTKDQIRSAILEVFPKIPEEALTAIVSHAFEEVDDREVSVHAETNTCSGNKQGRQR